MPVELGSERPVSEMLTSTEREEGLLRRETGKFNGDSSSSCVGLSLREEYTSTLQPLTLNPVGAHMCRDCNRSSNCIVQS